MKNLKLKRKIGIFDIIIIRMVTMIFLDWMRIK